MKFKNGLSVVMTCAAVCVFAASQSIVAPLALLIGKDFGHGIAWSGLLFAAYYILNIVVCPFAGRLVSGLGQRHHAVSVGLFLFAGASLLLGWVDRFPLVCLCLAALGVAAVFVLLVSIGCLCLFTGRTYTSAIPEIAIVMAIGSVLGAVYCGIMLFHDRSWKDIFFWLGVAMAVFALFYTLVPFPVTEPETGWQSELGSAFRLRRMYSSYFTLFLYAGAGVIATGWMAGYMMHTLGYTPVIVGIADSLLWGCVAVGRVLCVYFLKRFPVGSVASAFSVLLVCSLCLCAAVPDGKLFWFAVFGVGLGIAGIWPLLTSAALDEEGGGATLSVMLLWECAGSAVFSLLAGLLGSQLGMRIVLVLSICLFVMVAFLMQGVLASKRGGGVRMRRISRPALPEDEIDMDDEAS